ncbi:MAG TPA: RNA methyltransferase [Syntrophobacteraceae bacterium]|nr:RNA methyltransferase [Syntrophobacteraceae bacterium]
MKTVLLYVALVHYPVLNRRGEVIASAVTNLDLHDLARTARTYEVPACYIVTPLQDQQVLIGRLLDHWCRGIGRALHPDREAALKRLKIVDGLGAVQEEIRSQWGESPVKWATTAKELPGTLSHDEARRRLAHASRPHLLLLGTGWGLAPTVMEEVDAVLTPIKGRGGYNHLSVRCAAAILMDRLLHTD